MIKRDSLRFPCRETLNPKRQRIRGLRIGNEG